MDELNETIANDVVENSNVIEDKTGMKPEVMLAASIGLLVASGVLTVAFKKGVFKKVINRFHANKSEKREKKAKENSYSYVFVEDENPEDEK